MIYHELSETTRWSLPFSHRLEAAPFHCWSCWSTTSKQEPISHWGLYLWLVATLQLTQHFFTVNDKGDQQGQQKFHIDAVMNRINHFRALHGKRWKICLPTGLQASSQSNNNISAWIDSMGFRNWVRKNTEKLRAIWIVQSVQSVENAQGIRRARIVSDQCLTKYLTCWKDSMAVWNGKDPIGIRFSLRISTEISGCLSTAPNIG